VLDVAASKLDREQTTARLRRSRQGGASGAHGRKSGDAAYHRPHRVLPGWGGQEIRILSESQGLIRRGHDVRLICPPEADICAEAKNWDVPAIALPIGEKRPLGVKVLVEWLKRNRCDVLSTHSSTDSWLAALALLVLGRPVRMVRTRHISAPVPRNMFLALALHARDCAHRHRGESLRRGIDREESFCGRPHRLRADRHRRQPLHAGRPRDRARRAQAAAGQDAGRHRRHAAQLEGTPLSHRGSCAIAAKRWLVIVGDGPQREALEALVDERNMRARVRFAATSATSCPGCRRSTSLRCLLTPTRACRRHWRRRCSSACLA